MKSTKIMIVAALAAGALLAGGSSMLAQDSTNTPPAGGPPPGEHGPGMKGGRPDIATALNLTDDQKPKVQEIMKGAMEKRKALREDTSLTPEDKRAKAKEIQDDTATQLKAVLTPEQFAKWQKMSQHMHRPPPGADNGGTPPPGPPPQN
jgi:periplasmic protein CpxP/Spy